MFTEEKEYKQRGRSSLYFTWTETDWLDLTWVTEERISSSWHIILWSGRRLKRTGAGREMGVEMKEEITQTLVRGSSQDAREKEWELFLNSWVSVLAWTLKTVYDKITQEGNSSLQQLNTIIQWENRSHYLKNVYYLFLASSLNLLLLLWIYSVLNWQFKFAFHICFELPLNTTFFLLNLTPPSLSYIRREWNEKKWKKERKS